jgi:asparagine synthase (glutamine-hydrolysing)
VSAICGVVGLDGRPWTGDDLDGVVRTLAPLGADGGGRWHGTAGRCGVAVAALLRQSTPEDAAERQPARSRDGSLVLVGDARLDNRDELASRLSLADDRSTADSAFVLAAYERWGEGFLDRIVGEFALGLVDRRRGGVLLARDHMGLRPLVVHRRRGVVAFASTALALTAFEEVGHALDVRHAAEFLALAVSERTLVEGVRWVPPATALWIDGSGVRRRTWWAPDPHDVVDLGSPAAHERQLREVFDRAVAAQLRSAGRVGASASGGLDSSSAAATAARQLAPRRLPVYTSAPPPGWRAGERPGRDADESPLVLKLAELHPNMAPHFVRAPFGDSLFGLHEPLWELGAGPARNPCNMLWIHAIRARAEADGVTTLLTGARGNYEFSADGTGWLIAHLRRGRLVTALREASAWSAASGDSPYRVLGSYLVGPLLPAYARRRVRSATGRGDPMRDWIAATALRPEVASDVDLPGLVPWIDVRRRPDPRADDLTAAMLSAERAETHAAAAALTGVEERDPTSDRRVLETAMRQPEWVRRHDGVSRAVARGAMADRLPAEIVYRTRRGEQLPDWLDVMTEARDEIASELEALTSHPTSRRLMDTARLEALVRRWPDRAARADEAVVRDYRLALLRALLVSRYLRWFEARAAAAASSSNGVPSASVCRSGL